MATFFLWCYHRDLSSIWTFREFLALRHRLCSLIDLNIYIHWPSIWHGGFYMYERLYVREVRHLQSRGSGTGLPDTCTIRTASLVRVGRAHLHLIQWPLWATDTSEACSSFAIELVFEFLVCYAATLLALQVQRKRIHVVRSNRVARTCPAQGHSRNGPWTWRHTHKHKGKPKRNRTRHTSINTQKTWTVQQQFIFHFALLNFF